MLAIIAGSESRVYPGINRYEPDERKAKEVATRVQAAMKILRKVAPDSGTYVNEADYFEANWQEAFWGKHYSALLKIKEKYDSEDLFQCHHCVGSEQWSRDGMCKNS